MDKFFESYQSGEKLTPPVALSIAQNYIRDITLGELKQSDLGRSIITELQQDDLRVLAPDTPDQASIRPHFWAAWICQG
jgi:hypothetical protein